MIEFFSSLSFLNSAALIGLAGLVVPIAIHLFDRSRGRVVWVGNISLIKQAKKIRVTEIKLTQWLLLLLRLLIVLISVLILASLVRTQTVDTLDKTQVLVSPTWFFLASEEERRALLERHQDDQVNFLMSGFAEVAENIDLDSVITAEPGETTRPHSLDALLLEYENQPVEYQKTIIYATTDAKAFALQKLPLRQNYEWRFKSVSDDQQSTKVSPLKLLVVFDANRQTDLAYIKLALDYLNELTQGFYQPQFVGTDNLTAAPSERPDWIVWLSDSMQPEFIDRWLNQGSFLLKDKGELKTVNQFRLIKPGDRLIEVYQHAIIETQTGQELNQNLWVDQTGTPLLIEKFANQLQWMSRFNPDHTNWVESDLFPFDLANLFARAERVSQRGQIAQSEITRQLKSINREVPDITIPLHHWLVIVLSILWLLERIVAERRGRDNG